MNTQSDFLDLQNTSSQVKTTTNRISLKELSSKIEAYRNCIDLHNTEWEQKHKEAIEQMLSGLPHGSGLDSGVRFSWSHSSKNKLVFQFSFHHLNQDGYYDGWTDHMMTITPEFGGFKIKISGQDRNYVKDYLYDLFYSVFE
jgi:hypothetical protein